ncbi:ATP-dependent permease [Exophiala dermatitidis]|nr:ATP-dependent permease [Exophiala dermatitidis]KAJ4631748.1 ATP-dependent permease [Exophiala dermatitidis]KAJ4639334.1 ATP-dependent permease [Exophiala dermatitidis]KAJ4654265.1 ATP-dependent permease [Exophiala dermatitidis]
MIRHSQDEPQGGPTARPTSNDGRRQWKLLFSFSRKTHIPIFAVGVLLSAAAGLLQPALAIVFGRYFQAFSDFASEEDDGRTLMDKTMSSVYALLGIGLGTFLSKAGLFASWQTFGELQARSIREQLFQALLDREVEWYEERTTGVGTLLTRLQTQIRDLQLGTSQPFGLSILGLVQGLSSLSIAFYTNWRLTLVVLSVVPVIALGVGILSQQAQSHVEKHEQKLTQATKMANNSISNIVTVKCFNAQDHEWRLYHTAVREAAASCLKQGIFSAAQVGFVRFAGTTMFVQGFWFGGTQVHSGNITPGEVVTAFWAFLIATKSFEDILPHIIVLQRAQAAAASLKNVLDRVSKGRTHKSRPGRSPQFCGGKIEVQAVTFAYPARQSQLVLRDCSFSFQPGHITFIIGKSGSGKSTIGQLLLGFYQVSSGKVLIDGIDLQDIATSWVRNNITLVQQQTTLFNETVFANIALGHNEPGRVTASQVSHCVQLADLQATIDALPGVDTRVGRGGSSLSGGQKQRIAIARARLRDTPVLILDEATSALDPISRVAIMQGIRRWRRGKTTIIITHDLTQIEGHDMVYILESGRVIRQGHWSELGDVGKEVVGSNESSKSNHYPLSRKWPAKHHLNDGDAEFGAMTSPTGPYRKDSFGVGADAIVKDESTRYTSLPGDSRTFRERLKQGLSTSTEAAIKNLKRQSLARAKAMYVLGPGMPQSGRFQGQSGVPEARGDISRYATAVIAVPRTPGFESKMLPIPPLDIELSNRIDGFSYTRGERSASVGEQELKTHRISTILASVWPILQTADRLRLICGLGAALCHAGAPAAFSYTLVQVFATYSLPTGYREKALKYSLAVLGIAMMDGIASFSMHYLLGSVSQTWVDGLRTSAMKNILRQPKGWFDEEKNATSLLISCLDRSAEDMKDLVGRFAAQLLVVAIMLVAAVIWSFITCWKITLVSLAASPLLYLLTRCFESTSSHWERRTNDACEQIGEIFVEAFTDIKTVRSLTLESYFHKKYCHATAEAFSIGRQRAISSGLFYGLSDSAIIFFTPLIFWYGGRLAKDREWPVKSILEVFSLLLFCTANASAVVTYIPDISSAKDTANRLLRLVRAPVITHENSGRTELDVKDPNTLYGPIHFINLTFFYPTRPDTAVLRQLNLTLPPGKCTAIVGASGSGKSTIAALILGLYPPSADNMVLSSPTDTSGGPPSLTLAGRDIRTLDLASLRSLIAIVPQTPVLLPATVRENISYGLPSNSPFLSAARIESAARSAGIHEFIQSLPQGYATVVGDGGQGVSGGQAQRIVIARALVRDPRILILDEATSALDEESADIIRSSIRKLVARKGQRMTVIMVTHAKEMMAAADHVVVLDRGTVVEQGSFENLLARRAALWTLLNAEQKKDGLADA